PLLGALRERVELLLAGRSADLLREYRRICSTLGAFVRVELSTGTLLGRAVDVDDDGCLLVDDGDVVHTVTAGDVVHVRLA
ncbi:MAG: biotin--[acetyl-CoA-carboxylase] ligase, partial [Actinobacteria bacterium]|nr:biotin--[acetyl-CoA-carboxylase] ligase [Actinomycetota bacterium]